MEAEVTTPQPPTTVLAEALFDAADHLAFDHVEAADALRRAANALAALNAEAVNPHDHRTHPEPQNLDDLIDRNATEVEVAQMYEPLDPPSPSPRTSEWQGWTEHRHPTNVSCPMCPTSPPASLPNVVVCPCDVGRPHDCPLHAPAPTSPPASPDEAPSITRQLVDAEARDRVEPR